MAAKHVADSLTPADVQKAIDAADDGDEVEFPSGSATWTSGVAVPAGKNLNIYGAGATATVLTIDRAQDSGALINMGETSCRLHEMGFVHDDVSGNHPIAVKGRGWRIDHITDTNGQAAPRLSVLVERTNIVGDTSYGPKGLIDHCNLIRVMTQGQVLMAHKRWVEPSRIGTDEAVYVEDCSFAHIGYQGNCIDGEYGGRYVFRHNTVLDATCEVHGIQGTNRACRSWEIYENIFTQSAVSLWVQFFIRGGTGVIFNNTLSGTYDTSHDIALGNQRSYEAVGDGGRADGTSDWDGNTAPIETYRGWPARDQIGRGADVSEWTDISPYPAQASEPAYFWNNTHGVDTIGAFIHGAEYSATHIVSGRDYFVNAGARPAYTSYTYPHPLQGEIASAKFVMVFK